MGECACVRCWHDVCRKRLCQTPRDFWLFSLGKLFWKINYFLLALCACVWYSVVRVRRHAPPVSARGGDDGKDYQQEAFLRIVSNVPVKFNQRKSVRLLLADFGCTDSCRENDFRRGAWERECPRFCRIQKILQARWNQTDEQGDFWTVEFIVII